MSEDQIPPYLVTDFCGACGERLVPAPLGGRYACHPDAAMYWSPSQPLPKDTVGHYQLTGESKRVQLCWQDESGGFHHHAPLWLYRSPR